MDDATLHVISWDGDAVASALAAAAGRAVRVRRWHAVPRVQEVRHHDVVVLDLVRGGGGEALTAVRALLRFRPAFVVIGYGNFDAAWVEALRDPSLHVIRVDAKSEQPLRPVIHALHAHLGHFEAELVTAAVMRQAGFASALKPLVDAICADPWRVRRPRELAERTGMARAAVSSACRAAGFDRAEHFITVVRSTVHDILVRDGRLTSHGAWLAAGVKDCANFRRQFGRATRSRANARPTVDAHS